MKIRFITLIAIFCNINILFAQQTFEKIIDLYGTPEPKIDCIIEIPGQDDFVFITEDVNGNNQILRIDKNTGAIGWKTTLTSLTYSTGKPSERLAYNPSDDKVIVVGKNSSTGNPAYVILKASDGTHSESADISGLAGTLNAVSDGGILGFFVVGTLEATGETRGIVARIDPGNSASNWFKAVDTRNSTSFEEIEYNDVSLGQNLVVVGRIKPTDENETGDVWNVLVEWFNPFSGSYIKRYVHKAPVDLRVDGMERVMSLGNNLNLASYAFKEDESEGLVMFHDDNDIQWSKSFFTFNVAQNATHFNVIDFDYNFKGIIGMIYSYFDEQDNIAFGFSGVDMYGSLLWAYDLGVDELSDVIAMENGGFAIIGHSGTENSLIFTDDNEGKFGCETNIEISTGSPLFEFINKTSSDVTTPVQATFTAAFTSLDAPSFTNGTCCWIPYEEFEYRFVWFCNTANLIDNNPANTNLTYTWYLEDEVTVDANAVGNSLTITPPPAELPTTGIRTIWVEDPIGCKGYDRARFNIVDPNQTITSAGVEDVYCPIAPPVLAPPISLRPISIGHYGHYEDPNNIGFDIGEDFNHVDWNNILAQPAPQLAHQVFIDPSTGCGPLTKEYKFDVLASCNCNTTYNFGSWNDPKGNTIYGVVWPINQSFSIDHFKITVEVFDNGMLDSRYLLTEGGGLPWFDSYWLTGFGPNFNNYTYNICLEGWFKAGGSSVCYYDKICDPNITVSARESNNEDGDNDEPYNNMIDPANEEILIYPNPTQNQLNLTNIKANSRIILSTIGGEKLKEVYSEGDSLSIDISSIERGIYVLIIIGEEGELISKLVVKN